MGTSSGVVSRAGFWARSSPPSHPWAIHREVLEPTDATGNTFHFVFTQLAISLDIGQRRKTRHADPAEA